MSDKADIDRDAAEKAKAEAESRLNNIVATLVALVATFVALCNVKDGNVVQAMAQAQANSVDTWAYYQSKSTKQNLAEASVDQLMAQRDVNPGATPEVRAMIDKRIAEYQAKAKQYEHEKAEIKKQAEDYTKKYDELNVHDDQFDMAEAMLSISIALFGITALTQKRWLLAVAGFFAAWGFIFGMAGFLQKDLHPEFLAKLLG
jgi:hypothetical protein